MAHSGRTEFGGLAFSEPRVLSLLRSKSGPFGGEPPKGGYPLLLELEVRGDPELRSGYRNVVPGKSYRTVSMGTRNYVPAIKISLGYLSPTRNFVPVRRKVGLVPAKNRETIFV